MPTPAIAAAMSATGSENANCAASCVASASGRHATTATIGTSEESVSRWETVPNRAAYHARSG